MASFLPESDSEDELPPGWEERATDDGHVFYVNHQIKSTQWCHPRTGKSKKVQGELPPGWIKKVEDSSGKTIFINESTNQTTYTDPRLAFAIEDQPQNISEIRQRFDSSSTALQVLHGKDLSNKLAVITGASAGIGYETARSLALHGCEVVFACRNKETTKEAISKISKEKANVGEKCHFMELDLSCLKSVSKFAKNLKERFKHVDILILNAGVFALPYTLTKDGLETTFQVCHLSHFYLTLSLRPLLDHTSRVIVVSSESHRFADLSHSLDKQILSPPYHKYWSMKAYNNVKLCNVLFARELGKRWQSYGISAFSLHPGNMVSSNLSRNWWFYRLIFAIVRPFTKSLQQAASTTVYCATATELTGLTGLYFNNCFFCEPSKLAQDDNLAQNLWEISENMVKEIIEVEQ